MNLPPLPEPYDYTHWEGRIKSLMGQVGMPESQSLAIAFKQLVNEMMQAHRKAVAAYKAELFQKYESSTERATEAEGDAFTHGYLCGEREAIVPESIKAAIKHAAAVLESEAGPLTREATAKGIRDTLREVLAASPEVKS